MSWFKHAPERRRVRRFRADFPVVASLVGETNISSFHIRADGISEAGLSLATLQGLRTGDVISLELHLPIAQQPLWLQAIVRHNGEHCGLEFSELTDEQRTLLKRYCHLQPAEKIRL